MKLACLIAALSGFMALSSEILWVRAFGYASESSPMSFGLLLGFYLAGVAAGSLAARGFCGDRETPRALAALGAFLAAATLLGYLVVPALAWIAGRWPWEACLPLVALAAGSMGAILPLAAHFAIEPDDRAGARLSRVYAANIAGSTLGSLLTGFFLMDHLTLRDLSALLAVAGGLAAAALLLRGARPAAAAATALLAVAVPPFSSPHLYDALWERLQWKGSWDPSQRFELVVENRNDVVCVTPGRVVYGGGAYEADVSTDPLGHNLIWRACAVAALHPAPRRVLVVGLATGAYSQVLAGMPGLERLVIVEINPAYAELVRRFPEVSSLLSHPKVELHHDDARRWFARHPEERFDAVIQQTSLHWRSHMTHLLSREYLALVRSRLRPGGVFAWNTTWSREAMAAGLAEFPHVGMLHSWCYGSDAPVAPDGARWEAAWTAWRIEGRPALGAEQLATMKDLLVRFEDRKAVEARAEGKAPVTDDSMSCEWADRFTH